MRRSLPHRLAILLLACAFVLATGRSAVAELGCVHHGSHHGAAGPAAEGDGSAPHDHAGLGEHAHDGSEPSDAHDEHGEACSCVSTCHAGSGAGLAATAAPSLPHAAFSGRRHRRPGAASGPRAPTPRLLPFANAPPSSR